MSDICGGVGGWGWGGGGGEGGLFSGELIIGKACYRNFTVSSQGLLSAFFGYFNFHEGTLSSDPSL